MTISSSHSFAVSNLRAKTHIAFGRSTATHSNENAGKQITSVRNASASAAKSKRDNTPARSSTSLKYSANCPVERANGAQRGAPLDKKVAIHLGVTKVAFGRGTSPVLPTRKTIGAEPVTARSPTSVDRSRRDSSLSQAKPELKLSNVRTPLVEKAGAHRGESRANRVAIRLGLTKVAFGRGTTPVLPTRKTIDAHPISTRSSTSLDRPRPNNSVSLSHPQPETELSNLRAPSNEEQDSISDSPSPRFNPSGTETAYPASDIVQLQKKWEEIKGSFPKINGDKVVIEADGKPWWNSNGSGEIPISRRP